MEYLYSADNKIVRRCCNLRMIREETGKNIVQRVEIEQLDSRREGFLKIFFKNGNYYSRLWADFTVLKDYMTRWRNLYGAPIFINGVDSGKIGYYNENLK